MNSLDADKPVAVITGGSGYLGGAICEALVRRGWNAASLSRRASTASGTDSYICDITKRTDVDAAISRIAGKYRRIDACIHAAAAPIERKPLSQASPAALEAGMRTALDGASSLAHAALPHMRKGSVFIGITTEAIDSPAPSASLDGYISAKRALRGFLGALSHEAKDIRVYAAAPGFLPGGLNSDLPKAMREMLADAEGSTVEAAAEAIAAICAEPDRFPAGSTIRVPSGIASPL